MAKQIKSLARANKAPKSDKALSLLVPESAPLVTVQAPSEQSIEQTPAVPVKVAKEVPDGYTHYTARDESTGTVFVTCQARSREYVSAVVADSPLGLIVARWTRDHKAALRYAKAINSQSRGGTPGMSGARVVDVKAVAEVPESAVALGRNREETYYQAAGFDHGPNWIAREAARAARIAAFATAQVNSNVQGPVEQA